MEQPCYKCGVVVEEGRPFCPHCSAPQIRVVLAEAPVLKPLREIAEQPSDELPAHETVPVLAAPKSPPHALRHCAIAALVGSLLMLLNLYPFVALLITGLLAVVFYRQGQPGVSIRPRLGARLGIVSGLLCFGISTLLFALGTTVPELRARMHDQVLDYFQQMAAKYGATYPQFQTALEQLKTPDGFVAFVIAMGVFGLGFSIILGSLGGFLGAVVLGRRDRE
jgi:hypothetical protein